MFLKFAKINPGGNMTILVLDSVPRALQSTIAEQLMAYGSVHAEQVGFLEETTVPGARVRLQMMGGEFCGNATMSLAAYLAHADGLPCDASSVYPLEVSGNDGIINCRIRRNRKNAFTGTVSMPLPEAFSRYEILPGMPVPLVHFPGIVHAIVPDYMITDAQAGDMVSRMCADLNAEAAGIILLNEAMDRIRPLVYVKETGSAVWENSCGSGTAAVGAWQAFVQGCTIDMCIQQPYPGGGIQVNAGCDGGKVSRLEISGTLQIAAIGEAWVDADFDN